jgi:hypothetical protein
MANEIYKHTWWGNITEKWGSIYKQHIDEKDKEKSSENKSK